MDAIFYEIFEKLPRQGPGDAASTARAFNTLRDLPQSPAILDVGCGTGRQTMDVAELTSGSITALDNHAPFITILQRNALKAGYSDKITCVVGDMASLEFPDNSFDVVWSEGAAYSMGFDTALSSWRRLLRSKGYLVVSELVWFEKDVPLEVKQFFDNEYPDMKYYADIFSVIASAQYQLVDYFPLPDQSWWIDFYAPLERVVAEMEQKYSNTDAKALFDLLRLEMTMHRQYSRYYGYGFYALQKTD